VFLYAPVGTEGDAELLLALHDVGREVVRRPREDARAARRNVDLVEVGESRAETDKL
jgi:hypothetical protein